MTHDAVDDTKWRCNFCEPPDFREWGFHTGKFVDVLRLHEGARAVYEGVLYHGYDLYGPPGEAVWSDVIAWRPAC